MLWMRSDSANGNARRFKVAFFDLGGTLVAGGGQEPEWTTGAKSILESLRGTSTRIGIISNTDRLSREELLRLLPRDFDFADFEDVLILLSSEVGVEKPALGIFQTALQRACVSPWEALFVGESLVECSAAQRSGMAAVRVLEFPTDFVALAELLTCQ